MDQTNVITKKNRYIALSCLSLIIIISFVFFYALQFSAPQLAGVDGYFHIKFSELMRKQGFIHSLPWLQYTIYKDYFRDHHLLFHILYIPFTFGNLLYGAKLAAVVFSSAAAVTFYLLLKANNIRLAFIWTIFFMVSSQAFMYRMSMPRVQSMSLLFLILAILFITKKKYIPLAVLSFFFVWLYDGFFILIAIVLIIFFTKWLITKKCDIRLLIYFFSGIALGIIVNPYFPDNVTSYFFNITRVVHESKGVNIGIEWSPYKTLFLLKDSAMVWILFFSAILLNLVYGIKNNWKTIALFLISILFFVLLFKSRRSIEYWPPFAILFSAFVWNEALNCKDNEYIFFKEIYRILAITIVIILFFTFSTINIVKLIDQLRHEKPSDYYKGAAVWLKENSEPGSIVFNTDWDDFPHLFFHNTENYYIVGLDTNYMYKFNADLYRMWKKITRGKVPRPFNLIKSKFNANFVISDNDHENFIAIAEKDEQCDEVYKDVYCTVFKIKG